MWFYFSKEWFFRQRKFLVSEKKMNEIYLMNKCQDFLLFWFCSFIIIIIIITIIIVIIADIYIIVTFISLPEVISSTAKGYDSFVHNSFLGKHIEKKKRKIDHVTNFRRLVVSVTSSICFQQCQHYLRFLYVSC